MNQYRRGLLFLSLIVILLVGCSASKINSPVAPEGDNTPFSDIPQDGHDIIASGTFQIDLDNMTVNDVTDRVGAFHYNITGFLSGRFKYYIQSWTPPTITLRLEIENPTSIQVYDVRIIYTNLYGKTVSNPDGYTNFLDPPGGPEINPFHYFAKEYAKQAFPVGPGAKDSEILIMNWPTGQPANVTYAIECSVGGNAAEPYKISNILTSGNITPDGGAMVVGCTVNDWQNDVTAVTILGNDFYAADMPMFRKGTTSNYVGNLMNVITNVPGPHTVWIKAESTTPNNVSLWMPFTVNVPDVTDNAPVFQYTPFCERERVSKGTITTLNGAAIDPDENPVTFHWEQLSPTSPAGWFLGTRGSETSNATWAPPEVYSEQRYIMQISAMESVGGKVSKAVVSVINEPAVPPEITLGPSLEPIPLSEGDIGFFDVSAQDPNNREQTMPLKYLWEQIAPASPIGSWAGTSNGQSRNPAWYSPLVGGDTIFTFKVTVTKDWVNPNLSTEGFVDFTVSDIP
jgi:hypothetical protein